MDEFERTLFTENYLSSLAAASDQGSYGVPLRDYAAMTDALVSVMYEATKSAEVRHPWKTVTAFEQPGPWASAFRKTEKTDFEAGLSIHTSGIFLDFGFRHAQELPSMDDQFWRQLLELTLEHGGHYELRQWPMGFAAESHEKNLNKRRNSTVFSMIADFIFVTKLSDRDPPVGELTFRFDWPGKWSRLVPRIADLITKGWRLNYQLYRPAYQRSARWRKRIEKQRDQHE